MKLKVTKPFVLLTIVFVLVSMTNTAFSDSVEWTVFQTMQLEEAAIDVAMSPDESLLFVLTEQGEVIIYSSPTQVDSRINVGKTQYTDSMIRRCDKSSHTTNPTNSDYS